ncbi:MAG TPA: type II toxin-antitoxin system VapC family toxin [Pirellulales bacterium]|nr:type II toxin-antitoxin system VapC family toxin [Pirellulales bacterium]
MKYVLDASVAVKWVLPEPDSPKALALRDDFRSGVHELIAPDTLPVEIAHALTRAERRNLLQHGESINRLSRVLLAPPNLYPYLPLLSRATGISSQARIGIYDCLYIALAEREQCRVVSADQRLVNTFPTSVVSLAAI